MGFLLSVIGGLVVGFGLSMAEISPGRIEFWIVALGLALALGAQHI